MALTYTWKLTGLKKQSGNTLDDVIVQTYWKVTGADADGETGEFSGATPFKLDEVDPDNFTAYEDLTEEIVLGWIQAIVVGGYKDHVDEQIQKQIDSKKNPTIEVNDGNFPWSANTGNTANTSTANTANNA